MATGKRASMREGPLADLFRKTAEDTTPAEKPGKKQAKKPAKPESAAPAAPPASPALPVIPDPPGVPPLAPAASRATPPESATASPPPISADFV